jgi:hypothetical protein
MCFNNLPEEIISSLTLSMLHITVVPNYLANNHLIFLIPFVDRSSARRVVDDECDGE